MYGTHYIIYCTQPLLVVIPHHIVTIAEVVSTVIHHNMYQSVGQILHVDSRLFVPMFSELVAACKKEY